MIRDYLADLNRGNYRFIKTINMIKDILPIFSNR